MSFEEFGDDLVLADGFGLVLFDRAVAGIDGRLGRDSGLSRDPVLEEDLEPW